MGNNLVDSILRKAKETGSANPIMDKMMKGEDKEVATIPLAFLKENPYQPRIEIKENEVKELAGSIQENGLLQPIVVYRDEQDSYIIIAGHRRVEAHKFLGKKFIKAILLKNQNSTQLAKKAIIENLQREDLNLIETAIALKRYKDEFNKSYNNIAKEIGKSKAYIIKIISVLNLPEEIIKDIKENKSTKDITALNMLNTYAKKLELEVRMRTDEINKNSFEVKNEILELYKGFLANGREWLKKEINNRLQNVSKNKKKDITVNFGKRKTKIELNIELNIEDIKALKEYLKTLANKKKAEIDIKENSY